MVKGYHKNNVEDYKRACAFHQFVARGIRAYAYPILFLLAAVALLIIGIVAENAALNIGAAILFALSVALPFITLAMQNTKIDKKVRESRDYLKTEQFFTFEKESLRLTIQAGSRVESYDIPFAQIPRVYARKDRYYIYIGASQILILKRQNIREGSAEELNELFRSLGKRFREKR